MSINEMSTLASTQRIHSKYIAAFRSIQLGLRCLHYLGLLYIVYALPWRGYAAKGLILRATTHTPERAPAIHEY